jgi:chemotaxis signal transduction protein
MGFCAQQNMTNQSSTEEPDFVQTLTIFIDGSQYAIETGYVDGVIATPTLSAVPQTAPALAGLARVRGDVGVFLDGRALVGTDLDSEAGESRDSGTLAVDANPDTAVLVQREEGARPIGVLVDDAREMERINVDRIVTAAEAGLDDTVFAGGARGESTKPIFAPDKLIEKASQLHD